MSDLRKHIEDIRAPWHRHDHWFDALCVNMVRGHMKELERLATLQPHDTGYAKGVRDAANIALAIDSGRGNEKTIANAILALLPRDSTASVGEGS